MVYIRLYKIEIVDIFADVELDWIIQSEKELKELREEYKEKSKGLPNGYNFFITSVNILNEIPSIEDINEMLGYD